MAYLKLNNKKIAYLLPYVLLAGIIVVCFMCIFDYKPQFIYELEYMIKGNVEELPGSGTLYEPYRIRCKSEFDYFVARIDTEKESYENNYIILERNINLKHTIYQRNEEVSDENASFCGIFDGNGKTISNFTINSENYADGIFRVVNGSVRNLTIKNCNINGMIVGGVAGIVGVDGKISNCNTNAVFSGEEYGEIAGINYGAILNCYGNTDNIVAKTGDNTDIDELYTMSKSTRYSNYPDAVVAYYDNPFKNVSFEYQLDEEYCTINGYYNEYNNTWYLVRPFSQGAKWIVVADDGRKKTEICIEPGVNETTIEYNGSEYKIVLVEYTGTDTLFINTPSTESVEYLYNDKSNKLNGEIIRLEGSGNVEKTDLKSITGRGNDSFQPDLFWKNSFALEFEKSQSFCDLPTNDDFVLLAGYRYSSLLTYMVERDFINNIGHEFEQPFKVVSFYLDGTYMGTYMLTGSMEIDENRIDISDIYKMTKKVNKGKLSDYKRVEWQNDTSLEKRVYYNIPTNPSDITGGYLIEFDLQDYPEKRSRFISKEGASVTIKSDNYASKEQIDYIADYWQDFEDAVLSEDGYNNKGKYYSEYIDLESMADLTLEFELSGDISFLGSVYFYKDSDLVGDGKLHALPHWDLERSFTDYKVAKNGSMMLESRNAKFNDHGLAFWPALYKYSDFTEILKSEWQDKYLKNIKILLSDGAIESDGLGSIDLYLEKYKSAVDANDLRWPGCEWDDKAADIKKFIKLRTEVLNEVFEELK